MKVMVPANYYNALLANAGKEDSRYYLNGFCVDVPHGCIIATDGHTLLKVPFESAPEIPADYKKEFIFASTTRCPVKGNVTIDLETGGAVQFFTAKEEPHSSVPLVPIDAKYVDWGSVLDPLCDARPSNVPKELPAFNPALLCRTTSALGGKGAVRFAYAKDADSRGAIKVLFQEFAEIDFILMPTRGW